MTQLRAARARWGARLTGLKRRSVLTYHRSLTYLADWLGLSAVDNLEPRPGIPPNPRHIAHVIDVGRGARVAAVLREVWFPQNASTVVASKLGSPLLVLSTMPDVARQQSCLEMMSELVAKLAELAGSREIVRAQHPRGVRAGAMRVR